MRDLFNLFDRGDGEEHPQQDVDNQQAIRNVLVRLRQHGAAGATGPAFDITVRVTLGSSRHLVHRPPSPSNSVNYLYIVILGC